MAFLVIWQVTGRLKKKSRSWFPNQCSAPHAELPSPWLLLIDKVQLEELYCVFKKKNNKKLVGLAAWHPLPMCLAHGQGTCLLSLLCVQ